MNRYFATLLGITFLVIVLAVSGVLYTVDETQQVIVTQFGRLVDKPKTAPGLYFKLPFVQQANYFDKRLLQWDGDANQMPTKDKRFIWVDVTARWRISDPLKFFQAVRTELGAQTRLDDIIDAATREVISSHKLIEVIRNSNDILVEKKEEELGGEVNVLDPSAFEKVQYGREELSRKILARASENMSNYGIELVDVRIKRLSYVEQVLREAYERMKEERKRASTKFRSEGQGRLAEIKGQISKELKGIQSNAYKTAQEIKGKADAEAIKIYADAYNKDPEFYSFIKTLETYQSTIDDDTQLILSTDNEFFEHLNGIWSTPTTN